ncbi:hypothetical protein CAAN3_16S01200 [[Candida] anglica]
MEKIKDGASGLGITVVDGATGLGHTVKSGMHGFGTTVQRGVSGVSEHTVSFKDSISNIHHKKEYDVVDELVEQYEHDIKSSIAGMKYMSQQIESIGTKHWPHYFKSNLKVCELLQNLMGQNSLMFKDIEKYYAQFTHWQAEQLIPSVHPKDKQFLVDSINYELLNYQAMLIRVRDTVVSDWVAFSVDKLGKIKEMSNRLKEILKLIKLRKKKKNELMKLESQISKLMKKTSPLDAKEQAKLNTSDMKLKPATAIFQKLDEKVKTILPHTLSFLDEFIEIISKSIICENSRIFDLIKSNLNDYSVFHGFLSNLEVTQGNFYDELVEQWEKSFDPVRLRLESSISSISEKRPDLIDQEVDPEVKKDSHVTKLWKKATHSITKSNPLKPSDHENGVFGEHQSADPLVSYEKYHNSHLYVSEVYHPTKSISLDDVIVPHSLAPIPFKEVNPAGTNSAPPPLPPRSNTAAAKMLGDRRQSTLSVSNKPSPKSNVGSPFAAVFSPPTISTPSMDTLSSPESDSDTEDLDSTSITSASSTDTVSSFPSEMVENVSSMDGATRNLTKIYNYSKNRIVESPITTTSDYIWPIDHSDDLFLQPVTSETYKLRKYFQFFHSLNKSNGEILEAKFDFKGSHPGDLSFEKGDRIRILYNFPQEKSKAANWLVGIIERTGKQKNETRIGFVPSNFF